MPRTSKLTELPVFFDWVEEKLPSSFKVDHFKHVSDHGPRVEWQPGTLVHSWFERLKGVRTGKMRFTIKDKKASLTLLVMENIWMTCWEHNGGTSRAVHYNHPQITRSRNLDKSHFDMLVLSMFGPVSKLQVDYPKGDPKPSGDAQIASREHMEAAVFRGGWDGARALVADKELEKRNSEVNVKRHALNGLRNERQALNMKRDGLIKNALAAAKRPYPGIKKHREACAKVDYVLKAAADGFLLWPLLLMDSGLRNLLNASIEAGTSPLSTSGYSFSNIDLQLSPSQQKSCQTTRQLCLRLGATGAVYQPEVRIPTHTVSMEESGPVLSSGIKLPFTEAALLEWLEKGEGSLSTRYGPLTKVKATVMTDGKPRAAVLLTAGCHVVDAADLGGRYAELLKPDFEPVLLAEARGEMHELYNPSPAEQVVNAEFRGELLRRLRGMKPWLVQRRRSAMTRMKAAVKEACEDYENKQKKVKELDVRIADKLAELAAEVRAVRDWHASMSVVSLKSFALQMQRVLVECQQRQDLPCIESNSLPAMPEAKPDA